MKLHTQRDFQKVQSLPFCYLCGKPVENKKGVWSRDHVPPKRVFIDGPDRTPPLQLPTHLACNTAQSEMDETIGEFIKLLHPSYDKALDKWDFRGVGTVLGASKPTGLFSGPDLNQVIWRWVCGFHAALYGEHLPLDWKKRAISTPFPMGEYATGKVVPIPDWHPLISLEIANSILSENVDEIISNNDKCRYVCMWDEGKCAFALQIYSWKDLGCPFMGQRQCVGVYTWKSPFGCAVRATECKLQSLADPMDPFSTPTLSD